MNSRFYAENMFRKDYFSLLTGDYSTFEPGINKWYLRKVLDHSVSLKDTGMIPVLKKLITIPFAGEKDKTEAAETVRKLEHLSAEGKNESDRISSARTLLAGTRLPQTTEILRLLRDNSVESKRLGIFLIGKFRLTDLLPEVCDCLNVHGLETDAFSVLQSFGETAGPELERFYLASSGNTNTSKAILRLLGNIRTASSRTFLFSRLWSSSRQLKELAIKCLVNIEFKPSEEEKDKLHQLISETIGIITWNLAARRSIERKNDTLLKGIISGEIARWRNYLFDLLSVTYERGAIVKIKENLDSETVESVNFALEMIDIVIDETIKQKLIMLVDSVPDEDKIRNLYQFYPVEVPAFEKLIEDILNRDYNLVSIWSKASVLRSIKELEGESLAESVVALLFSPEEILQEESAKIVSSSAKELYRSVARRLPAQTATKLDKVVSGETGREELLYEKTSFLSGCFPQIAADELLSVAMEMKHFRKYSDAGTKDIANSIIWPLTSNGDRKAIINYEERSDMDKKVLAERDKVSFYVLPLSAASEFDFRYPGSAEKIFEYIKLNEE